MELNGYAVSFGITIAFNLIAVIAIKFLMPFKSKSLLVSGALLFILFALLSFFVMPLYNKLYILAGVQWGLFGASMYCFNSIRLNRARENE